MSTSHYILSLSRVEPMGAAVLEGIASGCRAIVTKEVGSKYDLLEHEEVILSFNESKLEKNSFGIFLVSLKPFSKVK